MKTLFIPCYMDGLPRSSGSARIRAEWVAGAMSGATVYDGIMPFAGFDAYVFQKAYLTKGVQEQIEQVAEWARHGLCVSALDMCDPDFLEPEHERRLLRMLPLFDFAVATTKPIRNYLEQWLPAYVIPDRVDLGAVAKLVQYTLTDTPAPTFVWAGYTRNMPVLEQSGIPEAIGEAGSGLDVVAIDRPVSFEAFWGQVVRGDVLVNPRLSTGVSAYKSDNKTLIAWALGMPVVRKAEDVAILCRPQARACAHRVRPQIVAKAWGIEISAQEWEALLRLYANRTGGVL